MCKIACVIPLYEADDKQEVENHQLISVLLSLSKVIERVIHGQVSVHVNKFSF